MTDVIDEMQSSRQLASCLRAMSIWMLESHEYLDAWSFQFNLPPCNLNESRSWWISLRVPLELTHSHRDLLMFVCNTRIRRVHGNSVMAVVNQACRQQTEDMRRQTTRHCGTIDIFGFQQIYTFSSCITNSTGPSSSTVSSEISITSSDITIFISCCWLFLLPFEFDLAWVKMCDFKLVDWANRLLQESNGQTYGLSPVWIRTCVRRLKSRLNRFPHPSNVH